MGNITNNKDLSRYEMTLDDKLVFATYKIENNILYIRHVEADPSLRGTGAAGQLMEHVMRSARENDYRVIPICGYALSWINRHKEFQDLLA